MRPSKIVELVKLIDKQNKEKQNKKNITNNILYEKINELINEINKLKEQIKDK